MLIFWQKIKNIYNMTINNLYLVCVKMKNSFEGNKPEQIEKKTIRNIIDEMTEDDILNLIKILPFSVWVHQELKNAIAFNRKNPVSKELQTTRKDLWKTLNAEGEQQKSEYDQKKLEEIKQKMTTGDWLYLIEKIQEKTKCLNGNVKQQAEHEIIMFCLKKRKKKLIKKQTHRCLLDKNFYIWYLQCTDNIDKIIIKRHKTKKLKNTI